MREERPAYKIADIDPTERPREKLARHGSERLSNAELLAILFRTGTRSLNAVELAETILSKFGSLRSMARADIKELQSHDGIGFAKAVEIQAAFELGQRLAAEDGLENPIIRSAKDVARLLGPEMQALDREHFKVLLLNTKSHVIQIHTVSVGSLNASVVHPRDQCQTRFGLDVVPTDSVAMEPLLPHKLAVFAEQIVHRTARIRVGLVPLHPVDASLASAKLRQTLFDCVYVYKQVLGWRYLLRLVRRCTGELIVPPLIVETERVPLIY